MNEVKPEAVNIIKIKIKQNIKKPIKEENDILQLTNLMGETQLSDKNTIIMDKTFTHTIKHFGFDNLSPEIISKLYKDGRVFSHFIEHWLAENYPFTHIGGCKDHDLVDQSATQDRYDQKTFTKNGCRFYPSNMIGVGRKFDKEIFEEKTKNLKFCIVSNIDFPEIKVKFVKGVDLLKDYPTGIISRDKHDKFFA